MGKKKSPSGQAGASCNSIDGNAYKLTLPKPQAAVKLHTHSIPEELQVRRQFVCWKYEERNSKMTKPPVNPLSGGRASIDNPRTWGSLDDALSHYRTNPSRTDGIGFVFSEDDPYCGIDLDKCLAPVTGELSDVAKEIIRTLDSYTELSPSGNGLHVIVRARIPMGGKKNSGLGLEVYDRRRYFTMTGLVLDGQAVIQDRQAELEMILSKFFLAGNPVARQEAVKQPEQKQLARPALAPVPALLDDDALLKKARTVANGSNFSSLWSGDTSSHAGDHSAADAALCSMLAFWTGKDPERMDRLFRRSELMRPKWDERHRADDATYGQMTIEAAVRQCQVTYKPQGKTNGACKTDQGGGSRPYILKPSGVYLLEERHGEVEEIWVCSPLEVRAMTRNERGEEWGLLLAVLDSDGVEHLWAMPMSMMAGTGEEYRRELLTRGLGISAGKGKQLLHNYLAMSRPTGRARCVSRIGWHGSRFVLPDEVYGERDGEEILLQSATGENVFRVAGDLAGWQKHVGLLCGGNSRLIFAVSAALAGPLLHLTGMESGGFHFTGTSSIGKTTILRAAGSICGGGGIRGFIRQWRTTDNGLESIAAAHCDCLLALDEMSQVDGRVASEIAYMVANGQGKSRAKRDGAGRASQEWRTLFLSTGEVGLADKVAEDGRKRVLAGQSVRVVDIPADAGKGLGVFETLHGEADGDRLARRLKEATECHYGSPLRAFLEKVTRKAHYIAPRLAGFVKKFVEEHSPGEADGQVKRVCSRFGLVAAAGELGIALKVLPWPQGEATRAAAICFCDWLERRGGSGAAEVQAGLEQVRAFFEVHGSSRFEMWGDKPDETRIINRAGFRRMNEKGEWEYFVLSAVFKSEVCRGFDQKMLVRELIRSGMLLPEDERHVAKKLRVPGTGQVRLYHFRAGLLEKGD